MPTEIERKFIVPLQHHALFVGQEGGTEVTQAYVTATPDHSLRVRIAKTGNLELAKMTVKGRASLGGLVRDEWEWPLPAGTAHELIENLKLPHLKKTRYTVYHEGDAWEVDVLRVNELAGRPPGLWSYLVVAEFEDPSLERVQNVALPPWVGRDVTGDPAFLMSTLTTEAMRDLAWRKAYLSISSE